MSGKSTAEGPVDTLGYNPRDPAFLDDPYPHYMRLRETCPVAYSAVLKQYVVSRDADIRSVCMRHEIFSNEGNTEHGLGIVRALTTADEPLHSQQRNLVNLAFTPKRVEEQAPFIASLADELIDGFIARGSCDLVSEYAFPITITVISRILGIPSSDFGRMKVWADAGVLASADPEKFLAKANEVMVDFSQYMGAAMVERQAAIDRGEPGSDLITALMQATIDGNRLEMTEFLFILWQLITAGHETTVALISNGIRVLSDHPEQKRKLLENPDMIENAVEEILRFEPPAHSIPRRAKEDVEVASTKIPAEARLIVLYASANRDAAVWQNPDVFDISRPLKELRRHIAFGYGIHSCMGSHLARLEGRIGIGKLLERLPNLAVDGSKQSERAANHFVRGWNTLWVKWDASGR